MQRVLLQAAVPILVFPFRPHLLRALQLNRQLGTLLAAALCKHLQLSLQSLHALAEELLVLLKQHVSSVGSPWSDVLTMGTPFKCPHIFN